MISIVTPDQLEGVAALLPELVTATGQNGGSQSEHPAGNHRLDVPRWLTDRQWKIHKTNEKDGWTRYFITCPFDPSHGQRTDTYISQFTNGKTGFCCSHNSCQGKQWADAKQAIGPPDPDHYDPPRAIAP